MARSRKTEEPANHERWLVSYADFITLLFAFFVVMFATSQADHGKAAQVSESVRKALGEGQEKSAPAVILGGTRGDKGQGTALMRGPGGARPTVQEQPPNADLAASMESLRNALKLEMEKARLRSRSSRADWSSAYASPASSPPATTPCTREPIPVWKRSRGR